MSPSPAERFSALLAASSDRGWTREPVPGEAWEDEDAWEDGEQAEADDPGEGRRLRPSTALVLLLLLAGAVAAVLLVFVPQMRPGQDDVVTALGEEAPGGEGPAGAEASAGEEPASDEDAGPLVVHVVGAVEREGVVELPAGARIADALEAAGGTDPSAQASALNLARPLADGEQVYVPTAAEVESGEFASPPDGSGAGQAAGEAGAASEAGGGAGAADGGTALIDLNTADGAALETLPGVGPVTAQAILDHREETGGFSSVEELLEVPGIGEATLGRLRDLVTV
ncbi:ComEA family DNA-binding protein [Brevibacterium salitolerans]|uniref:Helix-hairpin-helix DNA-binding motif class 1 domain-containing protein n=2 Tax=Brevibacterium TaxID=1696 RepID=A0ABN2WEF3_9MICO